MFSPKSEKGKKHGLTILPLYYFSFIFTTGKYICSRQIHCKSESQKPASIKMELLWIHISMTKNPLGVFPSNSNLAAVGETKFSPT